MPRLIRDIRAALAEQPEDEADELLDEDAEIEVDGGSLRR
jgi:hypothetical protein